MSKTVREDATELCRRLAEQSVDAIRRDIYGDKVNVIEVNPVGAARLMICIFDIFHPAMLRLSRLPESTDVRELIMGVLAVPNTHPKLVEIAGRLEAQL